MALEHWYTALWHYNGSPAYLPPIFKLLQKPAPASDRWPSVVWDNASDKLSVYKSATQTRPQPTLGANTSTKAAHVDVDFDGSVDVILSKPRKVSSGTGDQISVVAQTDSVRGISIVTVTATVTGGALPNGSSIEIPTSAGSDALFAGTTTAHFTRSKLPYLVEFSVELAGTGSDGNTASGITWEFAVP